VYILGQVMGGNQFFGSVIFWLILLILLAVCSIPALIARKKGRNFFVWWLYGIGCLFGGNFIGHFLGIGILLTSAVALLVPIVHSITLSTGSLSTESKTKMRLNTVVIFGMIGGGLGALVGLLMRPSLPLVGQPPLGEAIGALFRPRGELDTMYSSSFSSQLFLFSAIGLIIGAGAWFLLGVTRNTSGKQTAEKSKCPHCAEEILKEARICKHCGLAVAAN
jgi:hypothetical protein